MKNINDCKKKKWKGDLDALEEEGEVAEGVDVGADVELGAVNLRKTLLQSVGVSKKVVEGEGDAVGGRVVA